MGNSHIRVAVTGYYGTGSSAVIDLLSEFDGVHITVDRRYEHVLLTCAGGIADLYARLFSPQSDYMIRDAALGAFKKEMDKQYRCNFGWYGSYKKLYGKAFMDAVDNFLSAICEQGDKKSLAHCTGVRFSLIKAAAQWFVRIFHGRKFIAYGEKSIYDGQPARYLTVDKKTFVQEAKKFVQTYLELCDTKKGKVAVFDHLLFPEQSDCVERFFDSDFKLIIVDRDPRDVYFSDKYFWSEQNGRGPFPKSAEDFAAYWRALHVVENYDAKNILFVKFEDLVYRYDETVKKVTEFCGLTQAEHKRKRQNFNPDVSIKNTQVFRLKKEFQGELEALEKTLSETFYDFPHEAGNLISEVKDI